MSSWSVVWKSLLAFVVIGFRFYLSLWYYSSWCFCFWCRVVTFISQFFYFFISGFCCYSVFSDVVPINIREYKFIHSFQATVNFSGKCRSSRSQMIFEIAVLKNFVVFTGKHLCWSPFRPATLLKKESPTQVFSCEYCEIFKNSFLIEQVRWLLLQMSILLFYKKDNIYITRILPSGDISFDCFKNSLNLDTTTDNLIKTGRFDEPLLYVTVVN